MADVTPQQIWDALEQAGASAVQAAGIMANMINESSLRTQSQNADPAPGDPGARAYGLVSWNTATYPGAAGLVTGNPQADLVRQVNFLAATGGFRAASGSTPQEVAGNFAANYERCQGCQSGGSQYQSRVANAGKVSGWAASGNWPQSAGSASDTANLQSAQEANSDQTCAWQLRVPLLSSVPLIGGLFKPCLLSKTQARAVAGAGIFAAGFLITGVGVSVVGIAVGLAVAEKVTAVLPGVGKGVSLARKVAGGSGAARATQATRSSQTLAA